MRALTNHMSTPPQNHDPCLLKSCSCHFAPTCTSLTPLQNLILRVAGKSKILKSVSRSSQGLPRTFRDAAETIRKSRASLCVSVIKLGRKLECMCAVFFSHPFIFRTSVSSQQDLLKSKIKSNFLLHEPSWNSYFTLAPPCGQSSSAAVF